ncbi:ABC transporter permease [Nonomuraea sp. NBC_01738]|uniref:ABC transporter permease n=1 Tax=Nonomuraea sp. NBC_01738 TaxID=2976003 RepID=UPI002E1315DF|nr:ABC transporter permease [Nonomuraea sp. NBC_01738]
MSAVWRAARAAAWRRRLQTVVIGLVVLCSATTAMLALGLLDAASSPFDKAFDEQNGAHVVASFDTSKVSRAQLEETTRLPGVGAAAGPFDQMVLAVPKGARAAPAGPLTVVGRAGPEGVVDHVQIVHGRWPAAPGEIVINQRFAVSPKPGALGSKLKLPGGVALTVVGFATSMSQSAGAWVVPEQLTVFKPPTTQMLYRFTSAATEEQLRANLAGITAKLPRGSLDASRSYLSIKAAFSGPSNDYLPFMTLFGVLGLVVSVLIVGNVISGAVISGFRHIGVLKALGFTPNQVVAVYLVMVCLPAVTGGVLGTALGGLLTAPVLESAFEGVETGTAAIAVGSWVPVVCLLGMPALAVVAALLPALRAHRLPAAPAISTGGASRARRGLRMQRLLGGTRLPRSVSLGLAQPFARPGRSAMTMAAIVLAVTTVTLSTGLTSTILAFNEAGSGGKTTEFFVRANRPGMGAARKLSDPQSEAMLRSLPGTLTVTAGVFVGVDLTGQRQPLDVQFLRGDTPSMAATIVSGRWLEGPGEVVVPPAFLSQRGLKVGDQITLELKGEKTRASIVGEAMEGGPRFIWSSWETVHTLAPRIQADLYQVRLKPGTDAKAYAQAVKAADPGLRAEIDADKGESIDTATVVGFASVFAMLLTLVASLGVFNTVLLNTRERRRDLGMLKSIGMTPWQVTAMTTTSMALLGAASGLLGIPLGMAGHRVVVDNVGSVVFSDSMKAVWHVPQLVLLASAGLMIAVLGALLPATSAARLTIAKVLHSE